MNASSETVTRLLPYPVTFPFPANRFYCEAWWTCRSTATKTWRRRSDCLIATGEPLSVIFPEMCRRLDIVTRREPRWTGDIPQWQGVACRIGRVEMWLPVEGGLPIRPFWLLVLLPRQEPPDALPYVYLGVQFFLEHRARLILDCSSGAPTTAVGQMFIP